MNEKEKADLIVGLINSAYTRFDQYTSVSWKLRISVWTAFGIAAGFIISAEDWVPGLIACMLGILMTLTVIIVVVLLWGPFTHTRCARWIRVAGFWESELEKLIGVSMPDYLSPKQWFRTGGWSPGDPLERWYKHPVDLSQALITVVFGSLLILALVVKTFA